MATKKKRALNLASLVLLVVLLNYVSRFRQFMRRRYQTRRYRMTVIMVVIGVSSAGRFVMITKPAKYRNQAGRWAFPQGGVRKFEVPLMALLREFAEETGVVLTRRRRWVRFAGRMIRIRKNDEPKWSRGKIYQTIVIEFRCRKLPSVRIDTTELAGALWISESSHGIPEILSAMHAHDAAKIAAYRQALESVEWREG